MRDDIYTEWPTIPRVAKELGKKEQSVRDWAHRSNDPLPCYLFPGCEKQVRVFRPDLNKWLMRNSRLFKEATNEEGGRKACHT